MRGASESAGVDMSDDAWITAYADLLARCGGDASAHAIDSWLKAALTEFISKIRGALGVGVEVLTTPMELV
jgi:hypothetical protein